MRAFLISLIITLVMSFTVANAQKNDSLANISNEIITSQMTGFSQPDAKSIATGSETFEQLAMADIDGLQGSQEIVERSYGCSTGCSTGCSVGCSTGCSVGCSVGCSTGCRY